MRRTLLILALAVVVLVPAGAARAQDRPAGKGDQFIGQIVPEESRARYPLNHYDIGYDPGGWTEVDRKITGFATALLYAVSRWLVAAGSWVITWAFTFGFAKELQGPAASMEQLYRARLIGPLGLFDAALFAAVAWSGWQLLRGRLVRGMAEFGLSLLIIAVGALMLRDPGGFVGGAMERTGQLSGEVLAVASSARTQAPASQSLSNPEYGRLLDPLKASIARAFVEDPYDVLDWGEVLRSGPCADIRDQILAGGPWGTDDRPRDMMASREECKALADFNADPSADRLLGAFLLAIAAIITLALLILVAGTVIAAQFLGVALIALMGFAVVGGILPGGGRQLLWRWLAAAARAILAIVAVSFLLSFLVVATHALLSSTDGQPLMERFAFLIVLVMLVFIARKRVLRAGNNWAASLGTRLESARVGGTHGSSWMRPAAIGAAGVGLADWVHDGREDLRRNAQRVRGALHRVETSRSQDSQRRLPPGPQDNGSGSGDPASPNGHGRGGVRRLAKLAADSTINLPFAAPRVAARATLKAQEVRARLGTSAERAQEWGRAWRYNAAHPIAGFWREVERQKSQPFAGPEPGRARAAAGSKAGAGSGGRPRRQGP